MNRLDNILGPDHWWDEYVPGANSVLCRLTIRLPDGSLLTKSDAGGYAGMADSGDDDKSGYSDSFKRAAVKFGVGRYLYGDGVPGFVQDQSPAVEEPQRETSSAPREALPYLAGELGRKPPVTGRSLFAWTKDQESRHQVGLLKYLNQWAKLQEFPGRMVDWDAEQVELAYHEAIRKLHSIQAVASSRESYDDVLAN